MICIYIISTLQKPHIDPDKGPLEDYVPLPTNGFQGPFFAGSEDVYIYIYVYSYMFLEMR